MSKINFSVTKNGVELDKSLYTWDEKTRTFSTLQDGLVLDFSGMDDCTFNTDYNCTFKTGSGCTFTTSYGCTFKTGYNCTFTTGSGCTFKTGSDCTFNTGYGCTFNTSYNCTFNTDYNCTFNTSYGCTFNTDYYCTFKTGFYCTFHTGSDCIFKTGSSCTFNTSYGCTFNTGFDCVVVRRDVFEVIQLEKNIKYQLAPFEIKGHIKDGIYSETGKPAIILDGILSHVLSTRKSKDLVIYKTDKGYIVQKGDISSHGSSIKEAKADLIYKISDRDKTKYKDIKLDTFMTFEEAITMYRVITGACEFGVKSFIETNLKKKKKQYKVSEIIDITKNQYGNKELVNFIGGRG